MESKKDDAQMHALLGQKLKEDGQVREAAAENIGSPPPWNRGISIFSSRKGSAITATRIMKRPFDASQKRCAATPADYVVRSTLEKMYSARGEMRKFLHLLEEILREHPEQKPILGTIRRIRKKVEKEGNRE